MAEAKLKKIKIYKLASEYNLSADSIVEFLSSEGFKVKSHMSNLNEEMISAVQGHFKKDIEKTQKHYQKLAEFQKIREDKARKDEEVVEEADAEAVDEKKVSITPLRLDITAFDFIERLKEQNFHEFD